MSKDSTSTTWVGEKALTLNVYNNLICCPKPGTIGVTCHFSSKLTLPWQQYFAVCFLKILNFTVLNKRFLTFFANLYI